MAERRDRRAAAAPRRRSEDMLAAIDDDTSLRRGADAGFLSATCMICGRIAEKAHAAGALLIAVVTEVVSLGLVEPPGAMGADIVVGEGQSIGNALTLRRALCRPVRDAAEIRAADARPPRRRDGRRRRQARLRADAIDARAAHPAREGDLEYLHQFRPLRARLHYPYVAARRGGPAAARAHQSRQRAWSSPTCSAACRASRC